MSEWLCPEAWSEGAALKGVAMGREVAVVKGGTATGKYRSDRDSGRSRSLRSASVSVVVAGSEESESQSRPRRGCPRPGEAAESHGREAAGRTVVEGTEDSIRLLKAGPVEPEMIIRDILREEWREF